MTCSTTFLSGGQDPSMIKKNKQNRNLEGCAAASVTLKNTSEMKVFRKRKLN